jgi:tetratricopeptide (TPR) repeat protein
VTRSFSSYGNPNLLAGFLAFGIFVNLGLALSEREMTPKSFYWFATILNSAVAITAFSRSLWVACIAGIVVFAVLLIRLSPERGSLDYWLSGLTIGATALFAFRSLRSSDAVMNFASRVSSIFDFQTGSALTRFQIWDAAGQATMSRPLFGWGPDTFRMVFRMFQPEGYNSAAGYRSVADNVHNYPLQVAAGIGIVGAVLLYVLQFWIIGAAARYCWAIPKLEATKKTKRNQEKVERILQNAIQSRMIYVGILAASVTYIVHLFFGLSLPGCTFLLWICFGVLLAPLAEKVEVSPVSRTVALAGGMLIVLVASASSVYATRLLWADHRFSQAQACEQQGDIGQALDMIDKSVRLSPSNDQYAMRQADYIVAAAGAGFEPFDKAVNAVEDLTKRFPNEYDVYLLSLWAYGSFAQVDVSFIDRGIMLAQDAIEKFPQGLALRYRYAELLELNSSIDEAIEQLEFCIERDASFIDAHAKLEDLQRRQ